MELLRKARDRMEDMWEAEWMNGVEEFLGVGEGKEKPEEGGGREDISDSGTESSAASIQPDSSPPQPLEDVLLLHASDEEEGVTDLLIEDGEITSDVESPPLPIAKRRVEPREEDIKRAKSETAISEPRKPVHQRLGAFMDIEGGLNWAKYRTYCNEFLLRKIALWL